MATMTEAANDTPITYSDFKELYKKDCKINLENIIIEHNKSSINLSPRHSLQAKILNDVTSLR